MSDERPIPLHGGPSEPDDRGGERGSPEIQRAGRREDPRDSRIRGGDAGRALGDGARRGPRPRGERDLPHPSGARLARLSLPPAGQRPLLHVAQAVRACPRGAGDPQAGRRGAADHAGACTRTRCNRATSPCSTAATCSSSCSATRRCRCATPFSLGARFPFEETSSGLVLYAKRRCPVARVARPESRGPAPRAAKQAAHAAPAGRGHPRAGGTICAPRSRWRGVTNISVPIHDHLGHAVAALTVAYLKQRAGPPFRSRPSSSVRSTPGWRCRGNWARAAGCRNRRRSRLPARPARAAMSQPPAAARGTITARPSSWEEKP